MNKINGYTEEEARELVKYVSDGKKKGQTLTGLFAGYAAKTGRAKGSVRNYYYALLRSTGDARVKQLLRGKNLRAEKIIPFSEDGDDKLMLRYQNKYRNVLARQPERIQRLMKECGLSQSDGARERLEAEINGLYDRLAESLKSENKKLAEIIKKLTDENALLKLQIKNMQ